MVAVAATVVCLYPACRRTETRAVERIAIIPFENLSGNAALDWIGPVLARVIADQLTASVKVRPIYVQDARGSRLLNCRQVVQGYYTAKSDEVRTMAVLRDLDSQRNIRWIEAIHPAGDAAATAETLAKDLDSRTRPFGTQNGNALQSWGESLRASDAKSRISLLERAIVADPNFGAAYVDLIETQMGAGDRPGALETAKRADQRMSNFTDLDRARVELIEAGVRGDTDQRRRALAALSRLISTDAETFRNLGDLEVNARRFDSAVDAYRNAAALDPRNPGLLNQLGYAEAYQGNFRAAREALERYRALDPEGLNPVDSLGEVHFLAGAFAEAEKYFLEGAAMKAGPAAALELVKAAQARFLRGDMRGADELYDRYEEALKAAKNPLIEVRRAQWLWITGRQKEASAMARAAANNDLETGLYARVQLAFWKLDEGDRQGAAQVANEIEASGRSGNLQRLISIARAAAGGPGVSGEVAPLAELYGAVASRDFARVVRLAKVLYERTSPSNDGYIRTLYAWALIESGRREEARGLLSRYYLPLGGGSDPVFTTQAFPHFLRLRGTP